MNKWLITFFVLILIIGSFVLLWFYYEKPAEKKIEFLTNLSIYAEDSFIKEYVITNYTINYDGLYHDEGKTLDKSPILYRIAADRPIEVFSTSKEYYNSKVNILPGIEEIKRVKLNVDKPTELVTKQIGNFNDQSLIYFNLTTKRHFNNVFACVDWTTNFIYVKANSTLLLEKPEYFKDYTKCYDLKGSLNESNNLEFYINYKIWGKLTSDDYIKIIFADSENLVFGDYNNKIDYWGENKIIEITPNIINI